MYNPVDFHTDLGFPFRKSPKILIFRGLAVSVLIFVFMSRESIYIMKTDPEIRQLLQYLSN